MRLATSSEMKQIEARANEQGITYARLMENAGCAIAAFIRRKIEVRSLSCVLFCGKGNNGGDGFVAARKLHEYGGKVTVVLADGPPQSKEAQRMLALVQALGLPVYDFVKEHARVTAALEEVDIIVDAVYGTGFRGALNADMRDVCTAMNSAIAAVFAADIPSGVNADTGACDPCAVDADFTVALDTAKPAHLLSPGVCGEVELVDIGIPEAAHERTEPDAFLIPTPEDVMAHLPPRAADSHKGTHGRLLNIAGSMGLAGAAILSGMGALCSGAGYVTMGVTGSVYAVVAAKLAEATAVLLSENNSGTIGAHAMEALPATLEKASAVSVGCGIGVNEDTVKLVASLIRTVQVPLLIDADGINCIVGSIDILKSRPAPTVLTPHLGEFSRLTGRSIEEISADRVSAARDFATEYGVTLLLKGPMSLTATPDGRVYINTTGNAGLAKAGSGDVLTGMIGAFLAQGVEPSAAAMCGAFLHGLAADRAAKRLSQYAMLPLDLLDDLAGIFLAAGR